MRRQSYATLKADNRRFGSICNYILCGILMKNYVFRRWVDPHSKRTRAGHGGLLLIALSGDPDRFRLGNRRCQTIMGLAHVTYVRRECLPSFVVIGGLLPPSKKRKLVRCCLLVTIFLFLTIFSFLFLIWFE
jgi:hypothetical protein